MNDESEPDLLERGRDLAERLKVRSRGHVVYDATMRKMSNAFSMKGEPLELDDKDARAARQLAEDATTVQRLVELADAAAAGHGRGPLFVGLVGAAVMLAGLSALTRAAAAFHLSAWVLVPFILVGPLLGWALTGLPRRRRQEPR